MIPVLIVEDEFLVRVGLQSMIDWEKYGFCVVADAPNGEKALELYHQYHPRLILTDIRMSPMDGLELMKRIRELDQSVRFIVISAYSEFEYAQQAIRYGVELYLNKSCFTTEDIDPVLQRIAAQYRQDTASQMARSTQPESIFDVLPSKDNPELLTKWFSDQNLLNAPKVIAVGRLDRNADTSVSHSVLTAVIRDLFEKKEFPFHLFTHESFIVILISYSDMDEVDKGLRYLCDTILRYFSPSFYMGVSGRFTQPSYVFQALSDACKTCNNFLFDKKVNLRFFQREAADSAFDKQLSRINDEIQSRLYAADREGVGELVARAVGSAFNYRTLERAVFSIIMSLERFDRTILVSSAFESIMSDDLEAISQSLIQWALKLCERKEIIPERNPVDEITEYIREHLDEDISLVRMAEMYFFSPNYLGQLFRQKTGIYFSTYVANLRINRACELLLETDHPVGTIGQMVGIEDPHYFSRIFKERMGVSPNKYRRMWLE